MIELEAKVWLNKMNVSKETILQKLQTRARFNGEKHKHDWYFIKSEESYPQLRVREESDKYVVCHKIHTKEDGYEVNTETEFSVDDKESFFSFLTYAGFSLHKEKYKMTREFKRDVFTYDLAHIQNLGDFLEIEILLQDDSHLEAAKKLLEEEFLFFGFTKDQFEQKRYLELLQKNKKHEYLDA